MTKMCKQSSAPTEDVKYQISDVVATLCLDKELFAVCTFKIGIPEQQTWSKPQK